MRQVADKPYGISENHGAYFWNLKASNGRVQGREQLIRCVDVRGSNSVEQRGFTRVGITHQGQREFQPADAPDVPDPAEPALFPGAWDGFDSRPQQTSVGF